MRYDRCAHTFFSAIAIAIAATVLFWISDQFLSLGRVVNSAHCGD